MSELTAQILGILFHVVGGLGIFMLGMKFMSEGVQTVAGPSLREMISKATDNRFLAVGTGTTFTLLVQSSSIATVIMVGLVNAGLMQLHQAVGFIMGANIGTTITGWILVFQVGKYGLPVLGISALVYIFVRNPRIRFVAMAIMGLGMVFFGLQLMKDGVEPIRHLEGIEAWIQRLSVDSFLGLLTCVGMGCLLTFLVQSSSAALGILIAAASTGLVPFPVAAAFILGENIGTTATVLLASLSANKTAKRAAYAHFCFNVFGVCWIVIAFPFVIRLVSSVMEWYHGVNPITMVYTDLDPIRYGIIITASIAAMHTSFNVANTILFLPFVRQFASFLEWLVPVDALVETPHLKHIATRNVDSPGVAIEQTKQEIGLMGDCSLEMMDFVKQLFYDGQFSAELEARTLKREETFDNIENEIVVFLTQTLQSAVPLSLVEEGHAYLRMAHEFESLSDGLAGIVKDFRRLRNQEKSYTKDQLLELAGLHDQIREFLRETIAAFKKQSIYSKQQAKERSKEIAKELKSLRNRHCQRILEEQIEPEITLSFTAILTHYRRVRANILNINQSMLGGKDRMPA